jgi:hypothetical protein
MPRERRNKEEYFILMNQFIDITHSPDKDPPREINWDRARKTLRKLRGVIRRMRLTKAERKSWNKTLKVFENSLVSDYDEAVEEYPIKMEQLLEGLKLAIEKVGTKEIPVREAWAAVTEVNSFFQRTLVKSVERDDGIRRFNAMVQNLKVVQAKLQLTD